MHWPDARLQSMPECGTPDAISTQPAQANSSAAIDQISSLPWLHLCAVIVGVLVAMLVSSRQNSGALWEKPIHEFPQRQGSGLLPISLSDSDLDRRKPQEQAEILLERAIAQRGALPAQTQAEIEARLYLWRGKLRWNAELGQLTSAALNSNDRSVRASAIDVQLIAYGLAENKSSVDALVQEANSSNHAQKVWALWALGLLANRGIETERIVQLLAAHLKDFKDSGRNFGDTIKSTTQRGGSEGYKDDADSRRRAVEGLALAGTTSTIAPLLDAMRNDPSPIVRECAADSLAESGMLSREERLTAVPQLIHDSDDPALDSQTRAWAFQALAEITKQHLPGDSAIWREWYQKAVVSGQ
jgi:HEAT repeat protein